LGDKLRVLGCVAYSTLLLQLHKYCHRSNSANNVGGRQNPHGYEEWSQRVKLQRGEDWFEPVLNMR